MILESVDIQQITADWIRNKSDEAAVRNGCRFEWERGAYAVWWIERMCRLYEGSEGDPLLLRGCHECDYGLEVPLEWGDESQVVCLDRCLRHAECIKSGHRIDWQYDCTMRVFGWTKWSDHWNEWIRRFRRAKVYISKKNKKSPTQAAWALYMQCGDGEPGQHVYLAAKDGQQVRDNTSKHLIAMLKQSPELMAECTLNLATLEIRHNPTASTCKPLSSSNARTQKSKEGLNGSVFIDETHVVDREFVNRIDRAGISRKEPIHAEFSTAGDDPDSYGKEQFDKCVRIISGELIEQDTFAAVYAAPQDLKDADLDSDPLKYGRMANPAMGHTVNPEEFLADYNGSKGSPSTLAIFKKYRLDIWQNSVSPWLRMDAYDRGRREFTHESLFGRRCWAALDLSSVCDFSSLSLVFPEEGMEDVYRYLWWFWLPEETAIANQSKIGVMNWQQDPKCRLTLTDGARIHFGAIRSKFRELASQYEIMELAYDDWNAEQTTQEISEGVTNHLGVVIEPPTGIPRTNFGQGLGSMNEPTKHFEASVIDGLMLHNGDPIARWMAQNATIKPDASNNYKPLKSADLTKKIDGVITAIMGRACAKKGNVGSGFCETPGSLAL